MKCCFNARWKPAGKYLSTVAESATRHGFFFLLHYTVLLGTLKLFRYAACLLHHVVPLRGPPFIPNTFIIAPVYLQRHLPTSLSSRHPPDSILIDFCGDLYYLEKNNEVQP